MKPYHQHLLETHSQTRDTPPENMPRLSDSQIAAYLDKMLQTAPLANGTTCRIGGSLQLFNSLLRFMDAAIACDLTKLKDELSLPEDHVKQPLWRHLPLLDHYFHSLYSDDFNNCPATQLFFDLLPQTRFRYGPFSIFNPALPLADNKRLLVSQHSFLDLVTCIQSEAIRINLPHRMQSWQLPVNCNILRANAYESYLFKRTPEITLIELMLTYPQSAMANGDDLDHRMTLIEEQKLQDQKAKLNQTSATEQEEAFPVIPPDTLKRDLAMLLGGMKHKTIFRGKIGHATSMEWSRSGGHFARIMLFFDTPLGNEETLLLGDQIGDYFSERTNGRMACLNCGWNPVDYPETGRIQANDVEKRTHLLRRLLLWAQKHQFLNIKASAGFRTFTTSDIPQKWREPHQPKNSIRKALPLTEHGHITA
ncbi:hypothetical protein [Castellaniella ginsengisoli]|uniref:Uncharacterized protein n=2 Tax=Castellaniella TaxID=359336 RepID=A0AB39D8K2_9BURK